MLISVTNQEKTLYSNVPQHCISCSSACEKKAEVINCHQMNQKRIRGILTNENYNVYICSDDRKLIKSARSFKEKLTFYLGMASEFEGLSSSIGDSLNKDTKRLLHNIVSLNGHNIQEVFDVIPQEIMSGNIKTQVDKTEDIIQKNTKAAAKAFLRIAKNNAGIKTEFNVFNKYFVKDPKLDIRRHDLRKVLMRVFHVFFQDFIDKKVHIDVQEFNGKVKLDYDAFHVALYYLFENAAKYTLPETTLNIYFDFKKGVRNILVDMHSMKITDEDEKNMFKEEYSGEYAIKTGTSGDGIGMGRIQNLLKLNNAKITLMRRCDFQPEKIVNEIPYERNRFVISFN